MESLLSQAIHIELQESSSYEDVLPLSFSQPRRSQACGKVILVGEHAVIYGAHAVAMPVPSMRIELNLQSMPKRSRPVLAQRKGHSENLHHVVCDALRLLNCDPYPLEIKGSSNILVGAGLGASAAFCVGILRALATFFQKDLDAYQIASLANQLERRFHGTPSGLDTMTVALEKPVLFAKNHNPHIIQVQGIKRDDRRLPWTFAVIDSGTRSPTLAMVQETAPYFVGDSGKNRISHFDKIARDTASGLESGALALVRDSMEEASHLLSEIGIVPPLLQDIITRSKQCGALAAKVTGAGGGGCILCLLDPERSEETLTLLKSKFQQEKVYEARLFPA